MIIKCDKCEFSFYIKDDPYTSTANQIDEFLSNTNNPNEKFISIGNINNFTLKKPSHNGGIKKNFCKDCAKIIKKKIIEDKDGIIESKETFEDFIEKSREWNEMRLAEKDKENLELKLQLKEKENLELLEKINKLEEKSKINSSEEDFEMIEINDF